MGAPPSESVSDSVNSSTTSTRTPASLARAWTSRSGEEDSAKIAGTPVSSTALTRSARSDADGAASVARTRLDGRTWLKLTLLNPATTREDTRHVVDLVRRLAADATASRTLEDAR